MAVSNSSKPKRRKPHYVLPSGKLVRLIRWMRNEKNEFVVRVTSTGKDRIEFLVSWFDLNAICVGQVDPPVGR